MDEKTLIHLLQQIVEKQTEVIEIQEQTITDLRAALDLSEIIKEKRTEFFHLCCRKANRN